MSHPAGETGVIRKRWAGRVPAALLFPGTHALGGANLGMQIVYHLLGRMDQVVCERFFLPGRGPLRSRESGRPLSAFPLVFCAVSFEQDYPVLARMLAAAGRGLEPPGSRVEPGAPLVVLGGAAVTINPEPLAPLADLAVLGEAEAVLPALMAALLPLLEAGAPRGAMLEAAAGLPGCYVPAFYRPRYHGDGRLAALEPAPGVPARVRRAVVADMEVAGHTRLLSPDMEMNLFMVEMGRGCSRACRFCAAGFIYRPPRLWRSEAVEAALAARPPGMDRVGLLGMEMLGAADMERIASRLLAAGCELSFSSLRADRVGPGIATALARSGARSAALALDGASARLRRVINKGLDEEDVLEGAALLAGAGIVNLKLYVMIGLPTETDEDMEELDGFIRRLHARLRAIGRARGRVPRLTLSVNCLVPKPWTPFQYAPFGGLEPGEAAEPESQALALARLRARLRFLRKGVGRLPNLRLKAGSPRRALEQAVLSRGDRRLAPALPRAAAGRGLLHALADEGLSPWFFALRPRERGEVFPWDVADHGISRDFLWAEYRRALGGKTTPACDTRTCRRCGVCRDQG